MKMPGNAWISLVADSARLCLEAHDVVGLRVMKAASGDFDLGEEALLMVTEKGLAAWDAGFLVAQSLAAGEGHLAPARALALYRRRVQANHSRLLKEEAARSAGPEM